MLELFSGFQSGLGPGSYEEDNSQWQKKTAPAFHADSLGCIICEWTKPSRVNLNGPPAQVHKYEIHISGELLVPKRSHQLQLAGTEAKAPVGAEAKLVAPVGAELVASLRHQKSSETKTYL